MSSILLLVFFLFGKSQWDLEQSVANVIRSREHIHQRLHIDLQRIIVDAATLPLIV